MHFNLLSLATLSLCTLGSASNPKRGLISDVNGATYKEDSNALTSSRVKSVSWYYSFGHYPDSKFSKRYDFVMQQFGVDEKPAGKNNFKNLKTLASDVAKTRPKHLFTFLEPAIHGITPEEAVKAWKQYIIPLKKKYPNMQIGSPSLINGGGSKPWIQKFNKLCPQCKYDFIDVHYYWTHQEFQNFVKGWHTMFPNKKIWVSDIGFQSSSSTGPQCKANDKTCIPQTKKMITWMDNTSWIERYTYRGEFRRDAFGAKHNQPLWCFLGPNAGYTEFGKWYLGIK